MKTLIVFFTMLVANAFAVPIGTLLVTNPDDAGMWVKIEFTLREEPGPMFFIDGQMTSHGTEDGGVKLILKSDTFNYVLNATFPNSAGSFNYNVEYDSDAFSLPFSGDVFAGKITGGLPPGDYCSFKYQRWAGEATEDFDQPSFILTMNGDKPNRVVRIQTGNGNDQLFCSLIRSDTQVSIAMNGGNDTFVADPSSLSSFHVQCGAGNDTAQAGQGPDDWVFPGSGTNTLNLFDHNVSGNEESWWDWWQ